MPTTTASGSVSAPAQDETELSPLEQAAASPRSTSIDGESVTEHSLSEQIELDRYLAAKKAAARKRPPIRLTKIIPGGTT
jgi:hypothetical protein